MLVSLITLVLVCTAAPMGAYAQFGSSGGAKFVADTGTQLDWWIPLYGGRGMDVFGLTLDLEMTVWPLLGEPVVLTHAGYSWRSSRTQITLYRGEDNEQFFAADGEARPGWETIALIHVHDQNDWWIDDDQPLPEYHVPREAFEELVHVWGFTYTLSAPVIGPYSESFSGIILRDGRSFNVPGSRSWDRLFSSISAPTYRDGSITHWDRHSEADAKGRVERALEECPADDPCEGGLVDVPVVRMNAYPLLSELARRSERFRDDFYASPKEALVTELIAGVARERPGSFRHARRTQLVDKALAGFADDISPDLADRWTEIQEHETRRHDAIELDGLGERLIDQIADEGEADDDLRAEVRRAADGVQSDWGQGRARLLLEWAAYEKPVVEPVVEKVSTGFVHTCGITPQGSAYCWGRGLFGRLGNGSESRESRPVRVAGGHTFAQISVGDTHTCGITSEGAAYCWGSNSYGKLGSGGPTSGDVRRTPRPDRVVGGHTFAQISVGDDHTCAITPDGAAYCWGDGVWGRLGNGSDDDADRPARVAGGHTFAQISAGRSHTCGITPKGVAYCWGHGTNGLLGNGSYDDTDRPVRVAGGHTFAQVSAGDEHTCGITPEGTAYCWGVGRYGQLGSGSTPRENRPVRVAGGHTFVQISAGNDYTCATTPEGAAYCWGAGGSGQLGNGSTGVAEEPVRVDAPF